LAYPERIERLDHAFGSQDPILQTVEERRRIEELDGIGCQPVLISTMTEEMLEWIGHGLRSLTLGFPDNDRPIDWPRYPLLALLAGA